MATYGKTFININYRKITIMLGVNMLLCSSNIQFKWITRRDDVWQTALGNTRISYSRGTGWSLIDF